MTASLYKPQAKPVEPAIGDGCIEVSFGYGPLKRKVTIYGGPITSAPFGEMHTLNLRAEAPKIESSQKFLIKDFGVPFHSEAEEALDEFLTVAIRDGKAYVGCWGGTGRTGLFLAMVAKAAGIPEPVAFVRGTYKRFAVETEDQIDFIEDLYISDLSKRFNRKGFLRALQFWK